MNRKTKWFGFVLALLLMFALLVYGISAQAADQKPITLNLTTTATTGYKVMWSLINQLADNVNKRTNGGLTIKIYPAMSLVKGAEELDALKTGSVDMALFADPIHQGTVPMLGIETLPFLYRDEIGVQRAMKAGVGDALKKEFLKHNIVALTQISWGFLELFGKVDPTDPKNLKGQKVRTPSDIVAQTLKQFGAAPVFMGSGEVFQAVQRGTVDGLATSVTAYYAMKFFEVAKVGSMVYMWANPSTIAISKTAWDKLSSDWQQILQEEANRCGDVFPDLQMKADKEAAGLAEQKGTRIVTEMPPERRAEWVNAAKPVWAEFVKRVGPAAQELIDIAQKAQK